MHTIENDLIRLTVQEKGAEIISIFDKDSDIEHIWNADPAFWPWHAPNLFPVVGRCLNDEIKIHGHSYKMQKHGFARNSDFNLMASAKDLLHFRLQTSEKTLNVYPYHFDFHIYYEIKGKSLVQTFEIENKVQETMYFQLGAHPAFAVPFLPGERYEDYFLEFEKDNILDRENINEEGYFDTSISNVIKGSNQLPLESDMFVRDAIILKDLDSRKVTLRSVRNNHFLSVEFPNFNYLGLWSKPGAPFLCIEPWLGCADTIGKPVAFNEKEGIQSLGLHEKFRASIIITIS